MQDLADSKTFAAAEAVVSCLPTAHETTGAEMSRQPNCHGLFKCPGRQTARVMKLTLLLLTVGLLQARANGFSQQVTLDVKDASLVRVFAIIKQQTGYVYFGATDLLAKARPVTIKVTNAPLESVLQQCFKDQPLDYMIDGKTISVFEKKKEAGTSISLGAPAPMLIDIRGRVTNEENEAVAGVSVLVKGTKTGTHTDGDGEFSLSKVNHDAVLVLTAVNIQSIEAPVGGQRNLELKVKGKTGKLDEVQVIAYGKTSQRFNVGNVTTVKAEDIEKQPVNNPLLALQGRVPGLEVTQLTGMNGGGVQVRIQGRNSINSGLEPLIVIDGVPYPSKQELVYAGIVQGGSPLNYINPADIESIDVLKDADATAIYGSMAANGAILLTTKKGKQGRTKLNVNLQQGWGRVANKVEMMNTRQYLDMRYEAYRNDGIIWSAPNISANDLKVWDTTRYTDWQEALIGGTAQFTNINAGISGGNANTQYLIGGTYNRQTTVFPGDFDNKIGSLHFNISGNSANNRLQLQLSGNYSFNNNHLPNVDLTQPAVLLAPNAPALYNTDGTLNWASNAAGNSTWENPLAYTQNTDFNNTTQNLVSNLTISYRLMRGLTIRTSAGYTNTQSSLYNTTRLEFYKPEVRPFVQRSVNLMNSNTNSWIIEPQLQYEGRVAGGKVDGILGTTIRKGSSSTFAQTGNGFASDLLMKTLSAATSVTNIISFSNITRFNALFARLNLNWADKYLLNLNARRDGSNKFGDANKFHNFWSVGAGWIFSGEKVIQKALPFLSFGKLRSSYGLTGNDQIAEFQYLSIYGIQNPPILYQGGIGLNATNIPNPHLQWEETRKWQSGIDLGILQDRILLNVTHVRNRSSNQLVSYTLPTLTGFSNIAKNLPATIQNTSWEFSLNTINLKTRNLIWSSSANLTIPRNKLVSFPGIEETPYGTGTLGIVVGEPLGVAQSTRYWGINPANGRYLISDKNGNPIVAGLTPPQNIYLSLLTNYYYGGLINNIRFKGIELDFLLQFVHVMGPKDFYYSNGAADYLPGNFSQTASNQPLTVLSRWQKPGDRAPIAPFTSDRTRYTIPTNADAFYSYDASYIRLKNLSLGWRLPDTWIHKARLQQAKLYVRGQNLLTITQYRGLDPETKTSTLPPLQLWTIGGQIEF